MIVNYSKTEEPKKEFYFFLGLLSTKFAIMESNLLTILGLLIIDNFVLTSTVLEKNSLAQNIDLLKKINKYRSFEEATIEDLIAKIVNIKSRRNLFIHGIWGDPFEFDDDIIITCYEPKLLYKQEHEFGEYTSKTWSSLVQHEFKMTHIKSLVETIIDILVTQDYLVNKLKNHVFE